MPSEFICTGNNPLHWDHNASAFIPLDSTDPNGTSFAYASSTCTLISTTSNPVDIATSSPLIVELQYSVILLIAIVSLLGMDFIRRLFATRP